MEIGVSSVSNVDRELQDCYSYSEPDKIRVKHLDLELDVLFEKRILKGVATLTLDRPFVGDLILDTRDLTIESVQYSASCDELLGADFEVGRADPRIGAPLIIRLPTRANQVRVSYSSSEHASGLQWLEAAQTEEKEYPFLFTQSEATHARSWIPLQDTPRVRMSFRARVRKPYQLKTVMSATDNTEAYALGSPEFTMPYPIPAYLIALAVGDLHFRELGPRTGVFAGRLTVDAAARELEDLDQMLRAAEQSFGPYRWGRYDVLVLPPSFPVGGMENPCLTFTTPTIIAGDKSLTSLIVHEIAHSWSSNLVSNATWGHLWINEGITVYMERRILETLYGRRRADMEAVLGLEELKREFLRLEPRDQTLLQPNVGDPNIGYSQVPYEKGALFLRTIEKRVGRPQLDAFLRQYSNELAFQSITTSQFLEYLTRRLLNDHPATTATIPLYDWIHGAGLPSGAALPESDTLEEVERAADRWLRREIVLGDLETNSWSTPSWLCFLRYSSHRMDVARMLDLDRKFHLTDSGNLEIECQWLVIAIRKGYRPAYKRLEWFLTRVGRRKYLKPLYSALAETPKGREWARSVYEHAAPAYHPITRQAVDAILGG